MNNSKILPHAQPERLIHARTGAIVGYRIIGVEAGPLALATGRRCDAEKAFLRLITLRSLLRLRGELTLMFQNELDDPLIGDEVTSLMARGYDGSVFISYQNARGALLATQERDAYWSVLRLCTRLGMISGRGVPGYGRSLFSVARRKYDGIHEHQNAISA